MRTTVIFKAITKNWLRSRSGLFFSFLFPVIFLLLFGTVFSSASKPIPLAVQNNDLVSGSPTPISEEFLSALNSTGALDLTILSPQANITDYVRAQANSFGGDPRVLVIPQGFQSDALAGHTVNVTYTSSTFDQLSGTVGGIISGVADAFNFQLLQSIPIIGVHSVSADVRPLSQVDYYLPGILSAFIMTNGVIGLTNIATEFKRNGLTKRLSATPLTKLEWILGNVLSQTVLALVLSAVMILLGFLVYNVVITIDIFTIAALLAGSVLFSGIGMTLAGVVKDPEAAAGLGNAIAFPMMFLSGTYWPVSIMPPFLQATARFLPLTYFSDALRGSMVLGVSTSSLTALAMTAGFAGAFIIAGAVLTRWKEP